MTKREVPTFVRKLLEFDTVITKQLVTATKNICPATNFDPYCKALEISCHGILWFAFWICFTWLFNNPSLIQMQVNMLLGLTLDIIFVAIIKAYTRRRRPPASTYNAMGARNPDQFSFPSGHASRSIFVTYFFLQLYSTPVVIALFLLIWAIAVCWSRILMNRHYILDVLAGITLGIFNGALVGLLFINEDTAKWMMNCLSDEKLDGGEFHV